MIGSELDDAVARSAAHLRSRAGACSPTIAVLLGSGWGALAHAVRAPVTMPYADLPAFPRPGVEGHAGWLLLGQIGGNDVIVLSGRQHTYETGDAAVMKGALRTLAALGVRTLVQTNAAGSLDARLRPGELMLIADHLNMVQRTPLVNEQGAQRFVDLRDAYDPALRAAALRIARERGVALHEGVYAWMHGPQFETPAEIRMLQQLGAHAVGMSTVPEVIVARQCGLRVAGLSCITNAAAGMSGKPLSHQEVLDAGKVSQAKAVALLTEFARLIAAGRIS